MYKDGLSRFESRLLSGFGPCLVRLWSLFDWIKGILIAEACPDP